MITTPSLCHWLPAADDDVNTTLPPAENVVDPPAFIIGLDGRGFTVMVPLAVLVQPFASVPVTV